LVAKVHCVFLWQQVICQVAKGTKDDVDAAVEAAHVSKANLILKLIILSKL